MIKLHKGEEPPVLKQNSTAWTAAVKQKLDAGIKLSKTEKSRYSHADIKIALVAETHGKCAYCESKIRHITYGDIEHITPKSSSPEKWFAWTNLTLACDVCNTLKSDFDGDPDTFIDPYLVDPEEHFWQLGPIVQARPGHDAAAKTEKLLKLNRPELIERRGEKLKNLVNHLDRVQRIRDSSLKAVLMLDFLEETKNDKEFAALAREIARHTYAKLDGA